MPFIYSVLLKRTSHFKKHFTVHNLEATFQWYWFAFRQWLHQTWLTALQLGPPLETWPLWLNITETYTLWHFKFKSLWWNEIKSKDVLKLRLRGNHISNFKWGPKAHQVHLSLLKNLQVQGVHVKVAEIRKTLCVGKWLSHSRVKLSWQPCGWEDERCQGLTANGDQQVIQSLNTLKLWVMPINLYEWI